MALPYKVYIGSFTHFFEEPTQSSGIYICSLDDRGRLQLLHRETSAVNPSFLCLSPDHRRLYACCEHPRLGRFVSYDIQDGGGLRLNSQTDMIPGGLCHLTLSADEQMLLGASYRAGTVVWSRISPEGKLSPSCTTLSRSGSGLHPRQDSPHAHQCLVSGDELYVPYLGLDRIGRFRLDSATGAVAEHSLQPEILCPQGSGPRHVVFSRDARQLYCIHELSNTLSLFCLENGQYVHRQEVSLLPPGESAEPGGAELLLTRDGRFLVASMRFRDCIVVFDVQEDTGLLMGRRSFPCYGSQPRMISLTPDERHLLIANFGSGDVSVAAFDKERGRVLECTDSIAVPCASYVTAIE